MVFQLEEQHLGSGWRVEDIVDDDNVIENQSLFQITGLFILVEQTLQILEPIGIFHEVRFIEVESSVMIRSV